MPIRKVISRSILDGTVADVDLAGGANGLAINAISSTITANAVDVFVYDTRKDSDGGAWRKRCQNDSWYNETLNTATRGSRRDFPAVAVIVATSTSITIYDADDKNMPMWMTWTGWFTYFSQDSITSVSALNGWVFVGSNAGDNNHGLAVLSFPNDIYSMTDYASGPNFLAEAPITSRGSRLTRHSDASHPLLQGSPVGNFRSVNDIAMTVLPNATVDVNTGLPNPTIALATYSGVSVIRDDGVVVSVNGNAGSSYDRTPFVDITSDGYLVFAQDTFGIAQRGLFMIPIPGASRTVTTSSSGIEDKIVICGTEASNTANPRVLGLISNGIRNPKKREQYIWDRSATTSQGLSVVHEGNPGSFFGNISNPQHNTMVRNVNSKFNTGWMPGVIRGAWLSDTVAGTVTGTELVTNGTFDTNYNGWTIFAGGSASVASGRLTVTSSTSAAWVGASQTISNLVIGKRYILSADIITSNNWGSINIAAGAGSGFKYGTYSSWNGGSTFPMKAVAEFVATTTSVTISIDNLNTTNATTTTIDNITMKLADEDRSANNKGLQILGSVTKTAVETGADLVAYSGFSTDNYLLQPYNAELNAGTGTYSFMIWFKMTGVSATAQYMAHRGNSDADESLRIALSTGQLYFDYGNGQAYCACSPPTSENVWHHAVFIATAGGVGQIYINGVKQVLNNAAPAPASFISNNYSMSIGKSHIFGGPWLGSLALARYSLSVPSEEQIKKIYAEEKAMFQAGAKSCFYGSSDLVTAAAYDDGTGLLHVGTSSGRSVFNGITRVENTSTAVTTAISASNGLVVEQ